MLPPDDGLNRSIQAKIRFRESLEIFELLDDGNVGSMVNAGEVLLLDVDVCFDFEIPLGLAELTLWRWGVLEFGFRLSCEFLLVWCSLHSIRVGGAGEGDGDDDGVGKGDDVCAGNCAGDDDGDGNGEGACGGSCAGRWAGDDASDVVLWNWRRWALLFIC